MLKLGSSTKVWHPLTCILRISQWSDKFCEQVNIVILFYTLLYNQVACLMANGYSIKSSTLCSDQSSETCTIKVFAMYMIVLMACSTWAFWWWAPTLHKFWDWCFSMQSAWKTSAANTSLSLSMCFISEQARKPHFKASIAHDGLCDL